MKVKAKVRCIFDIEYEVKDRDIEYTKEVISMMSVDDLLSCETEDSLQFVSVIDIKEQ